MKALKGARTAVLVDKLGERLAFERTGVRLYDALLQKRRAEGDGTTDPPLPLLERFRAREAEHFALLAEAIASMGGDPKAETPCADVSAVMSSGLPKVMTDPRTTLTQCLEAILVAELADNDGWTVLIDIVAGVGLPDFEKRFRQALADEEAHLAYVRQWLTARVRSEAGLAATT